jgi:hypothetical protein
VFSMLFWRGQIYHNIIKFSNYIYIHLNHLKLTISSSSSFWMLFFFLIIIRYTFL